MAKCDLRYADLGKRYMDNALQRTKRDPWDSFIYGLALTMTRSSTNHNAVLKDIKSRVPNVKEARASCTIGQPYIPTADMTYDPNQISQSICSNSREKPLEVKGPSGKVTTAEHTWDHLAFSMNTCDREGVRKHYTFRQHKGPDMLLLESGCNMPVMDVWMMRYVLGVTPEGWSDSEVEEKPTRALQKWKSLGADIRKAGATGGEPAVTTRIRQMQNRREEYEMAKRQVVEEAKACGIPAGEFHVGVWFEQVFGDDRAVAEIYLNELIGAIKE
jgi:hypothetical protein